MRKFLYLIIGLMILAGCSSSDDAFGEPITDGEPTPIPTAVVPSRPVYTVERGEIIDERALFGRVSPIISIPLQFEHDGRVAEIYVERDDDVEAGEVIAQLDTGALEQALFTAQSDLEIAESLLANVESQIDFETQRAQLNLELAQLELNYARNQASNPPTPDELFEIRRLEIARDLAQLSLDELNTVIDPQLQVDVTRAQQAVADIEAEIDMMSLVAPMSGTVTSLQIDVGDSIQAFDAIGLVSDESELEVRDSLPEETLEELNEGMVVNITAANRPGEIFPGTIGILPAPYGSGDDEFVHILFDNPEDSQVFRPGDRVSVNVIVNERDDALWLPRGAIREFNGRYFIVVEEDDVQRRVDVELGIAGDGRVEILSGAEEGQTVIGQ